MILAITRPAVAFRDCADCLRFVYDEETGEPALWRGGKMPRHKGCPAPCVKGACPKGSPDAVIALSERNFAAWLHFQECGATGQFPDDAIVRQNARVIRDATNAARLAMQKHRRNDNRSAS